jgi:hypothetical protein
MIRRLVPFAAMWLLAVAAGANSLYAQQGRVQQQDLIDHMVVPKNAAVPGETPNQATMRVLRAKTDFKVEIMPLDEFAKFINRRYNIPVRVDLEGLKQASVDPSVPISAEVSHKQLVLALRQILNRYNLTFHLVRGTVVISNKGPQPAVAAVEPGRVVLHNGQAVIIQRGDRAANAGGALKEHALRQLGPLLQVELLLAKRKCRPTKEQTHSMREDLRNYVKDEVNDFFDLMQGRVARTGGGFHVARKLLDDRLAKFIAMHLSKERADGYREEVKKRDANEREINALNLVALLDRELNLAPPQRAAIQKSLVENWDDAWSQTVDVGVMRGQNYVPSIPDEIIETHLDAAQIEVWESLTKIGNVNWGFQVFRLGWFGMPVDDPDEE